MVDSTGNLNYGIAIFLFSFVLIVNWTLLQVLPICSVRPVQCMQCTTCLPLENPLKFLKGITSHHELCRKIGTGNRSAKKQGPF